MRLFAAIVLLLPVYALAQDAPKKAPMPEPKNLKILTGQTGPQLMETMRNISVALGVRCDHCHVRGDFASDENPKKETARMMMGMTREINAKFPADGKRRVSCYTCHRGAAEPLTAPPPAPEAPK